MRLTERDLEILRELKGARWLTTSQLHRRFFGNATADAARKRLRKHSRARYLTMHREHHMAEAVFALGREGRRLLEEKGAEKITLERSVPKQWEHFYSINDLRIAAELTEGLSYFFAHWELHSQVKWPHPIIPDAVFCLDSKNYAAELDRGGEGIPFLYAPRSRRTRRACPVFRSPLFLLSPRRRRG